MWISVEEKLPEKRGYVLVVINGQVVCREYNPKYGNFIAPDGESYKPQTYTHWQPLPPPPEERSEPKATEEGEQRVD